MARSAAVLGVLAALVVTPVDASRVVVLVDSHRLLELNVSSLYLLPDGSVVDHDRMIRACGPLRTAGWVVYDPKSDVCRREIEVLSSVQPTIRPEASGIVVFDTISRQACSPGACRVLVGMRAADDLFSDRFEATP